MEKNHKLPATAAKSLKNREESADSLSQQSQESRTEFAEA
jgi:hypothetical protein